MEAMNKNNKQSFDADLFIRNFMKNNVKMKGCYSRIKENLVN